MAVFAVSMPGLGGGERAQIAPPSPSPRADSDLEARIARAWQRERQAVGELQRLLRSSEDLYRNAARKLETLDASLEATRATLRRMGYLTEKYPHRPG